MSIRPPLLQIPLDIAICRRSDEGKPIVVSEPHSPCALAYKGMASSLYEKLKLGDAADASEGMGGPKIVVE